MELKTAGELMIPLDKYPHIPYWFTLRQAMVEMEKYQLDVLGKKSLPRFVLVFDEKYQLLGLIRRRDILRGLETQALTSKIGGYKRRLFESKRREDFSKVPTGKLVEELKENSERQVSDIMHPIVNSVEHQDHLLKVINDMVEHNLSLMPVIKDGKVAGVVRSVDVLREIASHVL